MHQFVIFALLNSLKQLRKSGFEALYMNLNVPQPLTGASLTTLSEKNIIMMTLHLVSFSVFI